MATSSEQERVLNHATRLQFSIIMNGIEFFKESLNAALDETIAKEHKKGGVTKKVPSSLNSIGQA